MNLTMLLLFSLHSVHYVLMRIFGLKNEENYIMRKFKTSRMRKIT